MYLSHPFVFSVLPILALATSPAPSPSSQGLVFPIVTQHVHSGFINHVDIAHGVERSLSGRIDTLAKRDDDNLNITALKSSSFSIYPFGASKLGGYMIEVRVGEAPFYQGQMPKVPGGHTFLMALDTGTAKSWILGSEKKVKNDERPKYNPDGSQTEENLGGNAICEIRFGDKEKIKGKFASDSVTVGNNDTRVQILGQYLCVAESYPNSYSSTNFPGSGTLGFGLFENDPHWGGTSFLQNVAASTLYENMAHIFGIDLAGNPPTATLGALGPNENFVWRGTEEGSPLWTISIDVISVGLKESKSDKLPLAGVRANIVTAADLIVGPHKEVKELMGMISKKYKTTTVGDSEYYEIPCEDTENSGSTEYDPIIFYFGSFHLVIPSTTYIVSEDPTNRLCRVGIMSVHMGKGDPWILGNIFLRLLGHFAFNFTDSKNPSFGMLSSSVVQDEPS